MFKSDKSKKRFESEKVNETKDVECYIVTDTVTGIEYLYISDSINGSGGITPLLTKH